jgi:hypothetical protein
VVEFVGFIEFVEFVGFAEFAMGRLVGPRNDNEEKGSEPQAGCVLAPRWRRGGKASTFASLTCILVLFILFATV